IWQERDPIKRLRRRLLGEHRSTEAKLDAIERDVTAVIDDAVKFADESPQPAIEELTRNVYVE
ncbi:MAG: thiamine pyrophosphate-dependent enzyme, partial [Candidatus Binataceae bacterium]